MNDLKKLTDLFRELGADDPESWASSQFSEGINQLGRFLFLREAWDCVVSETDHSWIDAEIRSSEGMPTAPTAGTGIALANLLKAGCSKQDISDAIRGMQYELLFKLCYLIDGPPDPPLGVEDFWWQLMQVSPEGEPIAPISALHESVLSMDPTRREMRPRATVNPD